MTPMNPHDLHPLMRVVLKTTQQQADTLSMWLHSLSGARTIAAAIASERRITDAAELEAVGLETVMTRGGLKHDAARRVCRAAAQAVAASGAEFRPMWSAVAAPGMAAYVTVARMGWGAVKIDLPDDAAMLVRFESAERLPVRFVPGYVADLVPIVTGSIVTARLSGDYVQATGWQKPSAPRACLRRA